MPKITEYIDRAKRNSSAKSDSELSRQLNLAKPMIHMYRNGKALPSDESMIRLAETADLDPAAALIDLNQWRANEPSVKKIYEEIAAALRVAVAAFILAAGIFHSASPVNASSTNAQIGRTLYIMENIMQRRRGGSRRLRSRNRRQPIAWMLTHIAPKSKGFRLIPPMPA